MRELNFRSTSTTTPTPQQQTTTELVSPRGIEPLQTIIEQRRVPGDLLESFSGTPTLIWILDAFGVEASAAADFCSLLGALLAGAASLGLVGGCTPLFVAFALLYLAVISPLAATARGSSLPWAELPADGLLLEAAFAVALWAPLWPKGKEEEQEEEEEEEEQEAESEDGSGNSKKAPASSSLSAPALAPAFLLRWIVSKNAFFRGLCRWRRINSNASTSSSLSLVALVADVALAPLALSPARLPRLVAAAALLVSWLIDLFASSSSSSPPSTAAALWTLLLRPALVLPLLHAGLLDSGNGRNGKKKETGNSSSKAKTLARLLVSAAAAVPALFSAVGVLYPSSSSSFEASLAKYAPYCLFAAGMTLLASLSADVLQSMSAASVGLEEGEANEETEGEDSEKKKKPLPPPPMTLSTRRKREEEEQAEKIRRQNRGQQQVQYVRGGHEPALLGAISLMLFCAGCLEVSSSVSSPAAAAADRGCSGGPGCRGGPAALVVARRLSWLARPWRATGPSFQSLMREVDSASSSSAVGMSIEVRSDCRSGGGSEEAEEEEESGWSAVAPRSHSSRVAAALAALSPPSQGEGEGGGDSSSSAPPPWLDHLLYRLISDPDGPVAASFDAPPAPPCAARAVVGGGGSRSSINQKKTKTTWASFSALEASDASSPASERLARHGWGPLVEYESPSRFGTVVADAVALPRKLFRSESSNGKSSSGGFNAAVAVAGAACSVVFSAAALAVVRRRREGSPPEATTASKKRD